MVNSLAALMRRPDASVGPPTEWFTRFSGEMAHLPANGGMERVGSSAKRSFFRSFTDSLAFFPKWN
jgi:hypothetical protein